MKDKIKSILREGTLKNSLGVTITRPDQVLIVMRGIPGSGKSTKAKELAGTDGVIHSTDDVIEAQGDYREFFEKMITTKDFSPLSKAHSTNLTNLTNSLICFNSLSSFSHLSWSLIYMVSLLASQQ